MSPEKDTKQTTANKDASSTPKRPRATRGKTSNASSTKTAAKTSSNRGGVKRTRGGSRRKKSAAPEDAARETSSAMTTQPAEKPQPADAESPKSETTAKKRPSRRVQQRRNAKLRAQQAAEQTKTAPPEEKKPEPVKDSAPEKKPAAEAKSTQSGDGETKPKKRPSRRVQQRRNAKKRAEAEKAAQQPDAKTSGGPEQTESVPPPDPEKEAAIEVKSASSGDGETKSRRRPSRRTQQRRNAKKRAEAETASSKPAKPEPEEKWPPVHREPPRPAPEPQPTRGGASSPERRESRDDHKTDQTRRRSIRVERAQKADPKRPLRRMIFSEESSYAIAAIVEGNSLTDFWIQEQKNVDHGGAGNIYRGVVSKVIPALQAAFVDIGLEREGFLSFQEMGPEVYKQRQQGKSGKIDRIEDALRPGDKVLVQIAKEAISDKGPALTTKISMPGRFLIFMPYTKIVRMSRMLDDKDRKALYDMAEKELGPDGGLIFRTASQGQSPREIQRDLQYLTRQWKNIESEFAEGSRPRCLHKEAELFERVLRDHFSQDIDEIQLYHPRLKYRIIESMRLVSPRRDPEEFIAFHNTPGETIWKTNHLEKEIESLFSNVVYLDCGGYIIIEEMETLTAIDVNTGRNTSGKDLEKTIFETNQQAGIEVARQLRLRQIGGIIIIDFIDMRLKSNQNRIFKMMERELSKDRTPTDVEQFTDLGLIQITRQRQGQSLTKRLTYTCAHCKGSGRLPLISLTK
ncbi:MAG: Rne/Rng family ribonuclease [bacterium]|nr:Rne/Rng family ribonuclease [bacterium]